MADHSISDKFSEAQQALYDAGKLMHERGWRESWDRRAQAVYLELAALTSDIKRAEMLVEDAQATPPPSSAD